MDENFDSDCLSFDSNIHNKDLPYTIANSFVKEKQKKGKVTESKEFKSIMLFGYGLRATQKLL